MAEEKKGFRFPSAYTILIIIVAIATWIVPAGQYEVNDAGEPIPGSYHSVESNPQRILADGLMAIVNGTYDLQAEEGTISVYNFGELYGAIDVAFFVLVIGGFLAITMQTGAFDAGIAKITTFLKGREGWMIAILMAVFALGGTTYGMAEETLAFYGLIVAVMIAVGYDALVGVAVVMIGAGIGTLASTVNPFATGIASGFAGTSVGDGLVSRLFILIVGTFIGIWFVSRYADKVKADPSKSLVFDKKEENEKHFLKQLDTETLPELTCRRKVILGLFALVFLVMIFSVIPWGDLGVTIPDWLPHDWWFGEFSALFLFFAIIIGFVDRMGESNIAETFVSGARDMLGVALIIGVARGLLNLVNPTFAVVMGGLALGRVGYDK